MTFFQKKTFSFVFTQETAVHVGTSDYSANAGGWRTKAEVRIQVTGQTLKVRFKCLSCLFGIFDFKKLQNILPPPSRTYFRFLQNKNRLFWSAQP
jgi:hypothetical protein